MQCTINDLLLTLTSSLVTQPLAQEW